MTDATPPNITDHPRHSGDLLLFADDWEGWAVSRLRIDQPATVGEILDALRRIHPRTFGFINLTAVEVAIADRHKDGELIASIDQTNPMRGPLFHSTQSPAAVVEGSGPVRLIEHAGHALALGIQACPWTCGACHAQTDDDEDDDGDELPHDYLDIMAAGFDLVIKADHQQSGEWYGSLKSIRGRPPQGWDTLDAIWGMLANVDGGDWDKQSKEWVAKVRTWESGIMTRCGAAQARLAKKARP